MFYHLLELSSLTNAENEKSDDSESIIDAIDKGDYQSTKIDTASQGFLEEDILSDKCDTAAWVQSPDLCYPGIQFCPHSQVLMDPVALVIQNEIAVSEFEFHDIVHSSTPNRMEHQICIL